jgi:hypothetical protein
LGIDRELIRQVRALDEYDLRRLLILVQGMLLQQGEEAPGAPSRAPSTSGKVTYRLQRVRCGKRGCASCPHGPYWYAYWREDGKVRSRYIGRELAPEVARLRR